MESVRAAVVGAGQSGLAASYWLTQLGIDHVLFDRGQTGDTWRHRWNSFCLVTPNWTLDLPGFPYDGDDPEGFLRRDAIVDYVERYRASFDPPVRDGVNVSAVRPRDGRWRLESDAGEWEAEAVIVAAGPFPVPSIPPAAKALDERILHLHSHDYVGPDDLPDGAVLVVGSAQSGCQIVDDLMQAGRDVWLAVSNAGRAPRRYRGRDVARWLADMGMLDLPIDDMPDGPASRFTANPHVSGRDGGKELNLRQFGRDGAHLVGRVLEVDGSRARFADDLIERLEGADEACRQIEGAIDRFILEAGVEAPTEARTQIDWVPPVIEEQVDLIERDITAVVWATGYHLDFSWIDAPVFGERDYPNQRRGVTQAPGLYFIGLNGLHTIGSSLFAGVGKDAEFIARHIGGLPSP